MPQGASALWYDGQGGGGLREARLAQLLPGHVRIRGLYGALSRGTERIVFNGAVPAEEVARMRCSHQDGEFPGPVKYGYQIVGEIIAGPQQRISERVFVLHPHQTVFDVPGEDAIPIGAEIPSTRAVLAANMETALNVVWDSGISAADRVLVVGGGVVGSLVARLAAQMPGSSVVLCDVDEACAGRAAAFGAAFSTPTRLGAHPAFDVCINTSGQAVGLQTAIDNAGPQARVVEASWYGAKRANLALGGVFHSQRLTLKSSQVGQIPPDRRPRWYHRRRLEAAIALLVDPVLDMLLSEPVDFAELPATLASKLGDASGPPCPLIRYPVA